MCTGSDRVRKWIILLVLFVPVLVYALLFHNSHVIGQIGSRWLNQITPGGGKVAENQIYASFTNDTWLVKREKLLSAKPAAKVFLFAYMRGGSSIAGELFNQDPHATMWYEPGDAFFCAYYGLRHENLPQNDLYYKNLTRRVLDRDESDAMMAYYSHMLMCEYGKLPPEAMGHYFLTESTAMDKFVNCRGKQESINRCTSHITKTCSGNLVHTSISNQCHTLIQRTRSVMYNNPNMQTIPLTRLIRQSLNDTSKAFPEEMLSQFVKHESCLRRMKKSIDHCLEPALQKCHEDHVRVVQVNRMKVENLEPLLQAIPDMYVIYYTRDPRAIALSRVAFKNLLWDKADNRPLRELQFLCPRMTEDLWQLAILEQKYPGAFLRVKYEDLVQEPVETARNMYEFFGGVPPDAWATFSEKTMHAKSARGSGAGFGITVKNATATALKWMSKFPKDQLQEAQKLCREYLSALGYQILQL